MNKDCFSPLKGLLSWPFYSLLGGIWYSRYSIVELAARLLFPPIHSFIPDFTWILTLVDT